MQISNPNLKNCIQNISKGLDEAHPFNDTSAVDIILQEAEKILSPHLEAVSTKNAGQIWGFILGDIKILLKRFVFHSCFG